LIPYPENRTPLRKLIVPIIIACLSLSFSLIPTLQPTTEDAAATANVNRTAIPATDVTTVLYNSLNLSEYGLSQTAFSYAYKGYQRLVEKKKVARGTFLTICDFSQSSRQKRLYIIDLDENKLMVNTYVAHGRNSGAEYATRFSNKPQSLESSLGFYITRNTYFGEHGLSLKIDGMDPGYNDRAMQRNIVIHGADYIGDSWLQHSTYMGRSYGCPAVPLKESSFIINTIKNGTCLFIYHPQRNYLKGSKLLNG
jgi:L,D-transpeptidase catalytic domain